MTKPKEATIGEYSDATTAVFRRAMEASREVLSEQQVAALLLLVDQRQFHDDTAVAAALATGAPGNGD